MPVQMFGRGPTAVEYPESDGEPMAENTLQFEWIVTIKEGLDTAFRDDPDVFVAGDLLWYPVEGDPTTRAAPDAMVVLGRPKGHRGSYRQWEEGGLPPQVVFEVLSPGNRAGEMARKFEFYERHGVDEYYIYDPHHGDLNGWVRRPGGGLVPVGAMDGWVSPLLGVRFDREGVKLRLTGPDGSPFLSYADLARERDDLARRCDDRTLERDEAARQRDEAARQRDEAARQRDEAARERDEVAGRWEEERRRAEALAARLKELGIDPDA